MAYRDEAAILEARRDELWRALERVRRRRMNPHTLRAREEALLAELRAVEARLPESPKASPLDRVRVASPCKAAWDDMIGDHRVRFCVRCAKNVYDLSAMTRDEAEALLVANEGVDLCVRLARRRDGTVITNDCPVGARRKRVRLAVLSGACAAAMACMAGRSATMTLGGVRPERPRDFVVEVGVEPAAEAAPPPREMGAPRPSHLAGIGEPALIESGGKGRSLR